MVRFGVFYVPQADTALFRAGTAIIGFDARRQALQPLDNPIRVRLPDFDEEYVKRPQKHGIHCTVVPPQPCRYGDLDAISDEIEGILNCFEPTTVFEMAASANWVDFWGKKQQIVVLKYDANSALLILHTALIARLAQYIAPNTDDIQQESLHEYHRIRHFSYPFIFDGFTPHFTLLFPYKGNQHHDVAATLESIFEECKTQAIESLCLMIQPSRDSRWVIYREFRRKDYPQDID